MCNYAVIELLQYQHLFIISCRRTLQPDNCDVGIHEVLFQAYLCFCDKSVKIRCKQISCIILYMYCHFSCEKSIEKYIVLEYCIQSDSSFCCIGYVVRSSFVICENYIVVLKENMFEQCCHRCQQQRQCSSCSRVGSSGLMCSQLFPPKNEIFLLFA